MQGLSYPNPTAASKRRIFQIVSEEAGACGSTLKEVLAGGRYRQVTIARHRAIHRICAELPQYPYAAIARVLKMHHTSVLYALNRLPSRTPPILARHPQYRRSA